MAGIILNGILYQDVKNGSVGKWSVRGGREYTTQIQAITDDPRVGTQVVLSSMGLRLGSYYSWPHTSTATEYDGGAFLQDISAARSGSDGKQWLLTLTYGGYDVDHEGGAANGITNNGVLSPFDMPPQIRWGSRDVERTWPEDFTDPTPQPYVNAAGDPLTDPPKTEDSNPVVTIVRNERAYDPAIVSTYKNRTNDGVWLAAPSLPGVTGGFAGYDDNTMKCCDISAVRQYDADWGVYWEVSYEFELRPDTWEVQILNAGLRSLDGSGHLKQIVAADGAAVSSPVCLEADGTYDPTSPPTPNYLTFQPYRKVDFSGLNIPWEIFVSGTGA
jgi:hypothetical protein